jgi:uncharacterized protein (DUF1697 family)
MALVVFMRGVNVGGARRFQPSVLARELQHLGVLSIGAAGTFVVREATSQAALRAEILRLLPFACDLMLCEGRDLLKLAAAEPFPDSPKDPSLGRFVSILDKRLPTPPALPWSYPAGEQWQVRMVGIAGRFVLSHWRRLGSRILEPNSVIEKQFGVRATTRSWNTILKVCNLLQP